MLVVVSKVELLDALIAKLRATDVSLRLVCSVKPISHLLAVAATQRNGLWSVVRCQKALFLVQQRALLLLLWVQRNTTTSDLLIRSASTDVRGLRGHGGHLGSSVLSVHSRDFLVA